MKLWPAALGSLALAAAQYVNTLSIRIETRVPLNSRLCNIYVDHVQPVEGAIDFTYGSCEQLSSSDSHHFITTNVLVGRSQKQHLDLDTMARRRHARLSRRSNDPNSILMDNSTGVDVWGPWFDGVEVLKNAECSAVDAAAARRKSIAIVGAGMSGLMAYLCLTQQGLSSVSIIEGGHRLGGRVQTVYLSGGPFDYSYQEMGPMRVPMTLTVANQTYNMSDHQLVFQLVEEMNRLNEADDGLQINFINWLEAGGRQLPHEGGSNRVGEIDGQRGRPDNQGAAGQPGLSMEEIFDTVNKALPCKDFCVEMANNMFTAHRKWLEAISTLPYTSACKVALEFETRFWEHLDEPIYGSCYVAGPDYPGIGSICYPSYNINGTGPGALLASYVSNPEWTDKWIAMNESEHVRYVLDAMVGIHGDVAQEQYTGKFRRVCGALDPLEGASWADPTVGQHQLYLPEYFKTHHNMIFIGEHTSYTHAWIASALESGIRGSVQLLLELGLVDEAKATVEKWMARWIEVATHSFNGFVSSVLARTNAA
ncbi:flavin-containing amine oxidoreductase-domain containing protein [Apiosordaria backusii]|uniref:Flavin-containing amine oxidoreductase-domain containing protein n=1 Tax=Apiosordaria backusii TaxID=314023 RepID=A0AA40BSI6_9PEZI|nr:flavin-containing amine oxidoreductase-domain containing protein [Apiosordaria backusii]